LQDTRSLKKKRKLCIFDKNKGEIKNISSVDPKSCLISTPLIYSYKKDEVSIVLLRELKFYLDETKAILRRKVNSSPAQPLLDDTSGFWCSYDETANLVHVRIRLKNTKENIHEIFLFPKNTALSHSQTE
jgi:hypothetical protein